MEKQNRKCVICERKPQYNGDSYCHDCGQKIASMTNGKGKPKYEYYAVYRGAVVGFRRNEDGTLKPVLLRINEKRLPKRNPEKVIWLDSYCRGFTRDQVKKLKATIMRLAGSRAKVMRVPDWDSHRGKVRA